VYALTVPTAAVLAVKNRRNSGASYGILITGKIHRVNTSPTTANYGLLITGEKPSGQYESNDG